MTKGTASPLNTVFLPMRAINIAMRIPIKYIEIITGAAYFGKNVLAKNA